MQVLHILKYKLLSFIKANLEIKFSLLIRNIGSITVYVIFAVGAFLFARNIIYYVVGQLKIGQFLLHEFISIIFFIFFIAVNVGNIIVSYATLFKSPEVAFLLTKPVKPQSIFFIKFLDNFFYSSTTLLLILLSVFAGYSFYFDLNILEFAGIIVLNILPFLLSAGSLGVIILFIILKLSARIGLRKIIYSLIFGYAIITLGFFKISSPVELVTNVLRYYPHVDHYFSEMIPSIITYLPNHWLSDSLYWTVNHNYTNAILYAIPQLVLSIVLFSGVLILGKMWYYNTWLVSLKIKEKKKKTSNRISSSIFETTKYFKEQTEVLIKKDIILFIREPSQVLHFVILLVLIIIFVSSISGVTLVGPFNYFLQTIIYLVVFLFNALLIATLSLRFVFPLISLEGQSFWKIKTSPMNITEYTKIKVAPVFIIIFTIAQILNFFSNLKFSYQLFLISVVLTSLTVFSLVFINYGLGGFFAIYKEKNPIRIASSQGASITFLVSLLYMLFLILSLFYPLYIYFEGLARYNEHYLAKIFYIIIFIGIISIVLGIVSFKLAVKSLKRDF